MSKCAFGRTNTKDACVTVFFLLLHFGAGPSSVSLVFYDWIPNRADLLDVALQFEHFGQDNLEDLVNVDGMRSGAENQGSLHGFRESKSLLRDFRLLVVLHVREIVVLGADQERRGSFIQQSRLLVPILDGRQRRLAREIKHEEKGHGVVADER